MFGLGFQEIVIVGIVAVLLFGKRLPEVARSLGSSYNEFRRGLNEIQSTIHYGDSTPSKPAPRSSGRHDFDDYDEPAAPRFQPPPAATPTETPSDSVA